ncbi:MAG: exo-alpha-sialidase [Acidobacteriota bacterium]|nr:exo-alpha-sialidase [Acidobacteriota bacterium]
MSHSAEEPGTPRIEIGGRVLVCPGGHAPKVVRLGDDHLLVAARTGLTGVADNSSVSLVESRDGGGTWTRPRTIIDSRDDERVQMMSRLPGGALLLGFTRRSNGACKGMLMTSPDEGRNWDHPFQLGPGPFDYVYPFGGVTALPDGELLLTAYGGYYPVYEHGDKPRERKGDFTCFFRSRDGDRWEYGGLIARFTTQPHLLRLSSGVLLASLRSAELAEAMTYEESLKTPLARTLVSESRDEGRIWSRPRQVTDAAEMQGFLLESSWGELVMTYSVRHKPYGVAIRTSRDQGKSWGPPAALADDAPATDVGLSQTLEMEPGQFLTLYHWEDRSTPRREANLFGIFWRMNPPSGCS